jgi:hypothetical protein
MGGDAPAGASDGRVESVHRSGVMVCLADGVVVALVPTGTPLHPWAVAAPLPLSSVARGDPVRAGGGSLCVGQLAVDLDGAEVAALRLRRVVLSYEQLGAATERLRSLLTGVELPPSVASACRRFVTNDDVEALAGIVGLGEGLTPSGDDVLVGLLAGFELTADATARARPLRSAVVGCLSPNLQRRTTRLSAQLLRAAAAGRYAEPVLGFLHVLASVDDGLEGDDEDLSRATATLLGMGHESGRSVLGGIVLALTPELAGTRLAIGAAAQISRAAGGTCHRGAPRRRPRAIDAQHARFRDPQEAPVGGPLPPRRDASSSRNAGDAPAEPAIAAPCPRW